MSYLMGPVGGIAQSVASLLLSRGRRTRGDGRHVRADTSNQLWGTPMKHWVTAICMTLGTFTEAGPATAQDVRAGREATDGIEIMTGVMDYDLSGTGTTTPLSIRATKALTRHLALEFGTLAATPRQQFGGSTFVAPEVGLSYSWRFGRVRPFVSGSAGVSLTRSDFRGNQWRSTAAAGGGARVRLSERLYAVGEMRLRGISQRWSARTAEWLGGMGWQLGR
jgi:hypothetical protein